MSEIEIPSQSAGFPHHIVERLRFSDTDRQGHINNAVFATLFESGRVAFLYDADRDLPPAGTQFVIAQLTIRFLGEMRFPGDVIVASGVSRIGTSSVTLSQALFVGDVRTATADSAIVLIDDESRRSTSLPDTVRSHFEGLRIEA